MSGVRRKCDDSSGAVRDHPVVMPSGSGFPDSFRPFFLIGKGCGGGLPFGPESCIPQRGVCDRDLSLAPYVSHGGAAANGAGDEPNGRGHDGHFRIVSSGSQTTSPERTIEAPAPRIFSNARRVSPGRSSIPRQPSSTTRVVNPISLASRTEYSTQ